MKYIMYMLLVLFAVILFVCLGGVGAIACLFDLTFGEALGLMVILYIAFKIIKH